MRVLQNVTLAILALVSCLGLSSCKDEDPYVDIIAVVSCSPDLLEFATPTVTITNVKGESQSFTLSPSEFKESDKGGEIHINVTINGVTSSTSSTAMNYVATANKRFDGETVSGDIQVTYSIKDNVSLDKDEYIFFHGIGYDSKAMGEDGISVSTEGAYIKPVAYELSKDEVETYLTELSTKIDKTSFNVKTPYSK